MDEEFLNYILANIIPCLGAVLSMLATSITVINKLKINKDVSADIARLKEENAQLKIRLKETASDKVNYKCEAETLRNQLLHIKGTKKHEEE